MLETLAQAGAWLVRDAQDFTSSVILLREAKNVTYKSFVKPGNLLSLDVTCRHLAPDASDFAGVGYCNQEEVAKARFSLKHFSIGQQHEPLAPVDQRIIAEARAQFLFLRH